ncbi:[FeFe] hydrogenase H-cluster radical SAM maturase HydE [Maridesulfovibrio salexigens]|uniref:Radical SAM domain protein n=1 Tax=Maridesulfovibrio salexigens (strain ATCC 14822 / DSM 2638 / NCIMB 8403 / VKM B-1763) TaxID=526222 RepID=C6BWV5_MARSD|nr:[FeFe] hydrogenase H-cluster radical SAM maturase HydE [Maridesulfovibrio salexigens]ACS78435.1 Radical SAM domain protein [Maridesulfovibrio salexigens DSM 2638]
MTVKEILHVLKADNSEALFAQAREIRNSVFGNEVFQRGVVEFSNRCRKNCHYCGLRCCNGQVERYSLDADSILSAARCAIDAGLGTVVLQSGDDKSLDPGFIGKIVQSIKAYADVSVTLCLGDHDRDTYKYWRDCGADRYLLKMETFNSELHARLRPGQSVSERLARLETLCSLGYEAGSGLITGLPGMTPEILAEDLWRLSLLPLDMIAVGPFIPHPDTPLGRFWAGSLEETLRATSLVRIMNSKVNIPATSALDALVANGREQGLEAGANVVMPSVTPESVRSEYSIYPGKNSSVDSVLKNVVQMQRRLKIAGFHPSSTRGQSPLRTTKDKECTHA